MRNAQGYACIVDPDEGIREADTFTCFHCQQIIHVKPKMDPADMGGLCKLCMKLICPRCVGGRCDPFFKRVEREEKKFEARMAARRSYGF
jgi:hypothetical protein